MRFLAFIFLIPLTAIGAQNWKDIPVYEEEEDEPIIQETNMKEREKKAKANVENLKKADKIIEENKKINDPIDYRFDE